MNWTRLGLLLRTNNDPNPLLFVDGDAGGWSQRFYRSFTNHLITFFPKPTGPFAVGAIDRVMIDPARTNLYRYTPRTNAFMVTFWYPAEAPAAGALPGAMWDKRVAADTNFYSFFGIDRNWAQIFAVAVAHRVVGVPLAAIPTRHPVLLFSNGVPGQRKAISQQSEELASHGYVVVAVDHSDCWATEFPDGRYLTGNHDGYDVPGRLKDMTFLLDELARLDSNDPLFAGRLDLDRIGGFGQSAGGTVMETCRTDARMKCAGIWDANLQSLSRTGLQKPILVALGETNFFYSEDLWLFNKATNNAVFFQIKGASHGSHWDSAWTDYDRDGFIDLFAANGSGQNDALYRNNGDGTFIKKTANEVGVVVADGKHTGPCNWVDYDNDGYPDLWVGTGIKGLGTPIGTHVLYHNNGNGSFTGVSPGSMALQIAGALAAWADYDNDITTATRTAGSKSNWWGGLPTAQGLARRSGSVLFLIGILTLIPLGRCGRFRATAPQVAGKVWSRISASDKPRSSTPCASNGRRDQRETKR